MPTKHRIFPPFADVYPHYVAKAEKKGRTEAKVDAIIGWLTGYSQQATATSGTWPDTRLGKMEPQF
ncbi:MAG TPA: hypothetical protein DCP71_12310 [Verrucomicrobiales bacterium]|nr:hypothetical protein [Verrucomicrobiales bacterium]